MSPTDEPRDPDELRDLLGAFALGALDDEEHDEVEGYVLDDAEARAELHKLEHAVAWLGHASPRPSEASWDAVRAEMARDLGDTGGMGDPAVVPPAPSIQPELAPVVDLTARRARPGWQRLTALAAAVALVVGFGLAMFSVFSTGNGSGTSTVALAAPDGRIAVTARIDDDGSGTIVTSSLPAPPAGHVYQLWSQPDPQTSMHSAGLLGKNPHGRRIHIPAHTRRIAISVEPAGGSRAPTTDPVAVSGDGEL
jgi:anti-sigma-K factor RskA